jgi:hypothetical protein
MATKTGTVLILDPLGGDVSLDPTRQTLNNGEGEIFRAGEALLLDPLDDAELIPNTATRRSPGDLGYGGMPIIGLFGLAGFATLGIEHVYYAPGASYYDMFTVADPATGILRDADSLPGVVVTRNRVQSVEMTVTVTRLDLGRYRLSGIVPATWNAGDRIRIRPVLRVGGRLLTPPVSSFVVGGIPRQGQAWPAQRRHVYRAGDAYDDEIGLMRADTGRMCDADTLPLVTVTRNGEDTTDMVPTIARIATGVYELYGTIPADWRGGDVVQISVYAVVAGKQAKSVVSSFVLSGPAATGTVWP